MVLVSFTQYSVSFPILGDPGAVSWSGKTTAKDFTKDGRENPWNATLTKPVPLLIQTLISDWAQEIVLCPTVAQSKASIYRATFLYEYVYQQIRLFAIHVWLS